MIFRFSLYGFLKNLRFFDAFLRLALRAGLGGLAVAVFIVLGLLQNLWRPIHVGRFDRDGNEAHAATLLSIESQASALAAALWAPWS